MLRHDYRDLIAGLALTLVGGASAVYAYMHYPMGTFTRMGPGMVPTWLGGALAVFGLAIAVPALLRRGEGVDFQLRALVMLSLSILGFGLMIDRFGLVPSVFVTAVVASAGDRGATWRKALVLGVSLCLVTWVIFIAGLRLNIPSFAWPW